MSLIWSSVPTDFIADGRKDGAGERLESGIEILALQQVVQCVQVEGQVSAHRCVGLVLVSFGDGEEVGHGNVTRFGERVRISLNAQAIGGRKREAAYGRGQFLKFL